METFSALLVRCTVNSPHKGQWRGTFSYFFDLRLNKRLSKQWWGWWFETLWSPLWRHSMPHNQCQSTQLWGLQHLWLANEISLLAHHRVPNWPEPGQRGAVGVCMSQPSRTYRLTNMQLNWPSVTSLWWKHSCLVSSVTVRNQMVLPNLLTSYKSGSLPAVSRSLIPRLQESDLDSRVTPLSLSGTPAHELISQIGSRCCGQL